MEGASSLIDTIKWNQDGLIPVITQDATSNEVLMLAWMNQDALVATIAKGQAIYWSRSRQNLWHKGATSGSFQDIISIDLDCDADTLLLRVHQHGSGACHTGARTCFFQRIQPNH